MWMDGFLMMSAEVNMQAFPRQWQIADRFFLGVITYY